MCLITTAYFFLLQTATQRGDAFTASIQVVTRYNSSVKYSPSPNFNDFLKDITQAAGSIRDTFLATVTMAAGMFFFIIKL